MRIAFFDSIPWNYNINSPWEVPLGGTQSAICYLAAALAESGQDVFLCNQTAQRVASRGVECIPLTEIFQGSTFSDLKLDAIIVSNSGQNGRVLRDLLGDKVRIILWTGHADDQPAINTLADSHFRDAYDGFAFVSQWQRLAYIEKYHLDESRCRILRNAMSPAFANLFAPDESIILAKTNPPIIAYTSTPFRGLNVLVHIFRLIRQRFPGIRLKVFSSMKIYNQTKEEDEKEFGDLYRMCRETEGIDYIGALPQPELAAQLRRVTLLAYPNTFPETSCIAVMEAMASGCFVVTSNLGALPETTAGFASLIPFTDPPQQYINRFVEQCITTIEQAHSNDSTDAERLLKRQVTFCNEEYTWPSRAEEWKSWLEQLCF